jgi:hypothetical protein
MFNNFEITGFLDCKISETCHPGSGTAEDRQQAPRHDDAQHLQESVYSGYIRCHGLKFLTVVFPNGLILSEMFMDQYQQVKMIMVL